MPGFGIIPGVRELPAEGVGKAIVGVEEERDVERVPDCLARHAALEHRPNRCGIERLRCKRERFEESEHRPELLVDRRGRVIREHEPRRIVLERRLRDRGVSVGSEDALVEPRHERREELALTH